MDASATNVAGSNNNFPENLNLQGDASVGLIKTDFSGNPLPKSIGRNVIFHVQMREGGSQLGFKATVKFRVTRTSSSPPGAGLAFFIAPDNYGIPQGSYGGNFGIFNLTGPNQGVFAVGFDTQRKTVGFYNESANALMATTVDGLIGNDVTAEITYDAPSRTISVQPTIGENPPLAPVTANYDLGKIVNPTVTVGVSGTTGMTTVANHDVLSWSFDVTV